MQNFQEVLKAELDKPVSLKNQPGATIDPIEAMVKSVMTNAMKGDLAAISFINTMTRSTDPGEDERVRSLHLQEKQQLVNSLINQLQLEGFYEGQVVEVSMIAETAMLVNKLDEMISKPDFQLVITDMKTGHQTVSPVIGLRDKQRELFKIQLQKLRDDAIKRKIQKGVMQ